jgi:beta-glucosidase-like glycosyl hydrolase
VRLQVAGGRLPQAALDRAAGNVLRAKFAAGLFDSRAIVNYTAGAINTPVFSELPVVQQRIQRELQKQFDPHGVFNTGRLGI